MGTAQKKTSTSLRHHVRKNKISYLFGTLGMFVLALGGFFMLQNSAHASISGSWCSDNVGSIDISQTECENLVSLYNSTNGDSWTDTTDWGDSTTICDTWYGVSCDAGHVAWLYLSDNNLAGAVPSLTGLSNLNSLELNNNAITSVATGAFAGLSNLSDLSLYDNTITSIGSNAFAGLPNLNRLDLSHNAIANIASDAFTGDSPLVTLYLSYNQLTALPAGIFSDLSNLRDLYLDNNHITGVPSNIFAGLDSLTTLGLGTNAISSIASNVFADVPNLYNLDISFNSLTNITNAMFMGITGSLNLNLDANQITTVASDAFDGIPNINQIYLSDNQLTTLPNGAFSGLYHLYSLWLNDNQLTSLPNGSFDGLYGLHLINLDNNQFTSVPVLGTLTGLGEIDISHNQIASIPTDAFAGLPNLNRLYLSYNSLTNLPSNAFAGLSLPYIGIFLNDNSISSIASDAFAGLPNLGYLVLDNNQLTSIEGISNPQILSLENNLITSIPSDTFANMNGLQNLDLSGNQITSLGSNAFSGLSNLSSLDLNNNNISTIDTDAFVGLPHLVYLYLQYNSISSIPSGAFIDDARLGEINLSHNQLTSVTSNEFAGSNLWNVDLSYNNISTIETDAFSGLLYNYMNEIRLNNNAITTLQNNAFDGVSNIVKLWLNDNQIDTIGTDAFAGLTGLHILSLSNNQLAAVPTDALVGMPALQELYLSGNLLTTLSSSAFAGLPSIWYLGLDSNNLSSIASDAFVGLDNLRTLNLGSDHLIDIPTDALAAIPSLGELHLENNDFSSIPSDAFAGLNLDILYLGSNHLTSIPSDAIVGQSNLEELHLNNNDITDIPSDAFAGLSNLYLLDLSYNSISSLLNTPFDGLSSLYNLYLQHNSISRIPSGTFSSNPISRLNLSENLLRSLRSDVIASISNIEYLYLSGNSLVTLPHNFKTLTYLDSSDALSLDNNKICTGGMSPQFIKFTNQYSNDYGDWQTTQDTSSCGVFSCENIEDVPVAECDALVSLYNNTAGSGWTNTSNWLVSPVIGDWDGITVSNGHVTDIELSSNNLSGSLFALSGLTDLASINLEGNTITNIENNSFAGLNNLILINLSVNALTNIPFGTFDGLSSLQSLALDQNAITIIETGVFEGLSNLTDLALYNNQLVTLPSSLGSLSSLTSLNLETNNICTGSMSSDLLNFVDGLSPGWQDTQDTSACEAHGAPAFDCASVTDIPQSECENLVSLYDSTTGSGWTNNNGWLSSTTVCTGGWYGITCDGASPLQHVYTIGLFENNLSEIIPSLTGLSSLQILNLGANQLTTILSGAFDGLSSLQSLYLDTNQLSALPSDLFSGLSSLTYLTLYSNLLSTLPSHAFDGLSSLQGLYLDTNQLSALPSDLFSGLSNLQQLSLGANQLSALPSDLFSGLSSLQLLFLDRNQLSALPSDLFSGLSSLQRLYLGTNQLSALPSDVFSGLSSLNDLYLDGNQLLALPSDLFSGLSSLQRLNLDGNQLLTLPSDLFAGLSSLQQIYLGGNQLTTIPSGAFDGLSSLQRLFLYNNQLSALPSDLFSGLSSLQRLTLGANQLSALPSDVFSGLSNLQQLYLDGNQLSALPSDVFSGLSSLTDLRLYNNQLVTLPENLTLLTNLFDLNTSTNKICTGSMSPELISFVDELSPGWQYTQDTSACEAPSFCSTVTDIPQSECEALVNLYNSTNGSGWTNTGGWLSLLTAANWSGVTVTGGHVSMVYLANRNLSGVAVVSDLPYLWSLRLSYNQLTGIGDFTGLPALQNLELQYNKLTNVPDLSQVPHLVYLHLEHNLLTTIPTDAFFGFDNIQYLYLNNNQLTTLPENLALLTDLSSLNVSTNKICTGSMSSDLISFVDGIASPSNWQASQNTSACSAPAEFDCSTVTDIPQSECENLVSLYDSTTGSGWTNTGGWLSSPTVCVGGWNGIFCNASGHVSMILGFNNNLSGTLPSLSGLTNLTSLVLSRNSLSNISTGAFNGLSLLSSIGLSSNKLTGSLPNDLFSGLSSLQNLMLDNNTLTTIPDLSPLSNIWMVWLSGNLLSTIPDYFSGFTNLFANNGLTLDNNKICQRGFNGNFLTFLTTKAGTGWQASQNPSGVCVPPSFSCNAVTDIPQSECENLVSLYDSTTGSGWTNNNGWLSSPTVCVGGWNGIFCNASGHVSMILGFNNNLSGTLPSLSGLTNLTNLFLSRNSLSNISTGAFDGLSLLSSIGLSSNKLTGSLPNDLFSGLSSLQNLMLDNNTLTTIPDLSPLSNIWMVWLSGNLLSTIPDYFSGFTNLFANNGLTLDNNKICQGDFNGNFLTFLTTKAGTGWQASQDTSACIVPSNTPPVATGASFSTDESVMLTVEAANGLLKSDFASDAENNTLHVIINTIPVHGILIIDTGDGSFSYSPDLYFNGTDHFTYYLNDGTDTGNLATTILIINSGAITDDIVNIPSDTSNQENIITEFTNKNYLNASGAVTQVPDGTYVGHNRINTQASNGDILVPFILQSATGNKIEMKAPANITVQNSNNSPFLGILNAPIIKSTSIATQAGLNNIVSVVDFGNNNNAPIYFKDATSGDPVNVQLRIPVPGTTVGDLVTVYYSHDGSTWTPAAPTNVINISGQPYALIFVNHLTMFAVGESTGSFVINNDAATTTGTSVTLNINATGVLNMRFQNDTTGGSRSSWEVYATTKAWTLSAITGTKTVYAQFDTDNVTATVEINTSDSINYTTNETGCVGANCGDITIQIVNTGFGYCDYGNTLNLGVTGYSSSSRDISSPFSTLSGNTAWFCNDLQGAAPRTLSIQSSDLLNINTNDPGQTILASNVLIKNPAATVPQGVCTANPGSSLDSRTSIDTDTVLFGKSANFGEVCKISTSNVDLKVTIPAYQAVGQYSGTLTITLPSL